MTERGAVTLRQATLKCNTEKIRVVSQTGHQKHTVHYICIHIYIYNTTPEQQLKNNNHTTFKQQQTEIYHETQFALYF